MLVEFLHAAFTLAAPFLWKLLAGVAFEAVTMHSCLNRQQLYDCLQAAGVKQFPLVHPINARIGAVGCSQHVDHERSWTISFSQPLMAGASAAGEAQVACM